MLLRLGVAFLAAVLLLAVGAPLALARPQYRGAQVHCLWSSVSAADMTQELNALQSAGANVLRVDVGWATLETAKGHYDPTYLAKLDALVSGAQARGIKVIATLWQTPSWASSGKAWNDPPTNPADYGAFARFITARYGANLAAVEAWNEPEINNNLISSNLPATYTQMVKAFYTGAKEGNAGVDVLAGSLAYADTAFLKALYADGIKGFYDGIAVHPYADGANPADTSVTRSFLGGIEQLHAAQLEAGDATPIWVTEFGWPTGTSNGANTEQQQAEYIEEAFGILDGLPYVKGASVYELRDMGTEASNPEDNFGLLRENFSPRPAYAAFAAAMQAAPGMIPTTPAPFRGTPEASPPELGAGSTSSGSGAGSNAAGSTGTGATSGTGSSSGAIGSTGSGSGVPTGSGHHGSSSRPSSHWRPQHDGLFARAAKARRSMVKHRRSAVKHRRSAVKHRRVRHARRR